MTEQHVKQQRVKLGKKKNWAKYVNPRLSGLGEQTRPDCEPHIHPSSLFRHNFLIMAQSSGV